MQFIYRRKINGNPYSCSGWLLVWVWHSDGCSSCFLSALLNGHINCYTTTMAFFTHNLSFSSLPSGKNVTFLHLCAAGEGVCELRYRTGTDLLCVITSLSARGEISCNIILKYMLGVWEKLSECHNFGLFTPPPPPPPPLLLPSQAQIHRLRVEMSADQNSRAKKKCEWEVTSIFVRPSTSLALFVCRLTPFPDERDSSHSASGNFLFIDWCLVSLMTIGSVSVHSSAWDQVTWACACTHTGTDTHPLKSA